MYGRRAFVLIVVWLSVVLLTVWLSASVVSSPSWYPQWLPRLTSFELSDSVLITLIGSTTANLVGLLYIVYRYVFGDRKPKSPN
jgi:hypothetical protein